MKKASKKTKPQVRTAKKFTIRIASFKLESASLTFVARDPKGKVLFRHTVAASRVDGL